MTAASTATSTTGLMGLLSSGQTTSQGLGTASQIKLGTSQTGIGLGGGSLPTYTAATAASSASQSGSGGLPSYTAATATSSAAQTGLGLGGLPGATTTASTLLGLGRLPGAMTTASTLQTGLGLGGLPLTSSSGVQPGLKLGSLPSYTSATSIGPQTGLTSSGVTSSTATATQSAFKGLGGVDPSVAAGEELEIGWFIAELLIGLYRLLTAEWRQFQ